MDSSNEEQLVQEYLKFHYELDFHPRDCTKRIDEKFPMSLISFPAVMAIHVTGSRSVNLWTDGSDTDTMYEIGPAKVYSNTDSSDTRFFENLKRNFTSSTPTKVFWKRQITLDIIV